MITIMLVDDEVLALEYLKNLIDWEGNGYKIVGTASNGRRALELYEKEKPDIVISDIRMVGMDGLELARQLRMRNSDVVVILLSAYKDFEYAKKGIQYGVSNYLLKHELCGDSLLLELKGIRLKLESGVQKKKIYRKYFMNQLIYNQLDEAEPEGLEQGNRFFIVLLHRNQAFREGMFYETEWTPDELHAISETCENEEEKYIHYVADVSVTPNNLLILYKIEKIASKSMVNSLIERIAKRVGNRLRATQGCPFNVIYSYEIGRKEISAVFQKMSYLIRYSAFLASCSVTALRDMPKISATDRIAWKEVMEELRLQFYEENQRVGEFIAHMFRLTQNTGLKLRALRDLANTLENICLELADKEGITLMIPSKECYKVDEIQGYYTERLSALYKQVHEKEANQYSKIVLEMIRYIRKNFNQELSLDQIGAEFQMSGVYLGQIFKKETGVTFLKFLTGHRMEEAKLLLEDGKMNVSEVAEAVGYKTSQYFSRIFIKTTNMTPQEYKKKTFYGTGKL